MRRVLPAQQRLVPGADTDAKKIKPKSLCPACTQAVTEELPGFNRQAGSEVVRQIRVRSGGLARQQALEVVVSLSQNCPQAPHVTCGTNPSYEAWCKYELGKLQSVKSKGSG